MQVRHVRQHADSEILHHMRGFAGMLAALLLGVVAVAHARAGTATEVTASGHAFAPQEVTITAGDSVHWLGSGTHNVHFDDESYRSGEPTSSLDVTHSFTTPGTYTYYCEVHKIFGMTGTVVVKAADGTTPTPTSTPTPSPEATAGPDLTALSARTAVHHGRVRGALRASPIGGKVTITATASGTEAGTVTLKAADGRTPFSFRLLPAARDALKEIGHLRVKIRATVRAGGDRASRTIKPVLQFEPD
jgi:plastocyanin